ncbi:hypothetical protein HDU98_005280 [Podochytrium sp. JEL0797]|nr:hypothetical protein HDU98_005280 [Podochytrium sp. JEL0797]
MTDNGERVIAQKLQAQVLDILPGLTDSVDGMALPASSSQRNATKGVPIGAYLCQNHTLFQMQFKWEAQVRCNPPITRCFISLAENQIQAGCRATSQGNAAALAQQHKHEFHFIVQDHHNAYKHYHFQHKHKHKHEFHFIFQDHYNAYKQYFEYKRELHFIVQAKFNDKHVAAPCFIVATSLSASAPILNPNIEPLKTTREIVISKRGILGEIIGDIVGIVEAIIDDVINLVDVVDGMALPAASSQQNATSIPIGIFMFQNNTLFEMLPTGSTTAAWTAPLTSSSATTCGKHESNHHDHDNADNEHNHNFHFIVQDHHNAYKHYHFEHHFIFQDHYNTYKQYFKHEHEFDFIVQDHDNAYRQYFEHEHELYFIFQGHCKKLNDIHYFLSSGGNNEEKSTEFIPAAWYHNAITMPSKYPLVFHCFGNHFPIHPKLIILPTTDCDAMLYCYYLVFLPLIARLSVSVPVLNPGASDPPTPEDHGVEVAKRQLNILGLVGAIINDVFLLIDVVDGMSLPSAVQTNATSIPIGTYMCQNQTLFEMQSTGSTTAAWTAQLTCSAATSCFISLAGNQTQIGCRTTPPVAGLGATQMNVAALAQPVAAIAVPTTTTTTTTSKDHDNDEKKFHVEHKQKFHVIIKDHLSPKHCVWFTQFLF